MSVNPSRPLSRLEQIEAKDMREGFDAAANRLTRSRERVILARNIQDGLLRIQSERAGYSDQNPDPLIPRLPQRELLLQRSINRLIGDRPYCHRTAQGGSQAAGKSADEAERFINAALDLTYPYEESVGLAHEGEWATVVLPTPADFRKVPDLLDAQKKRKGGYSNSKDYKDRKKAYLASRPPWTCRLISATDCAPTLVRGRGKRRWEVSQLYVRTLYDVDDLIDSGYIFDQQKIGTLVPTNFETNNPYGQGGQVYLYETYATIDGDPCVAYSVAGLPTRKFGRNNDGKEQIVRINLAEEFGINTLPVGYFFGLNRAHRDDPDAIGMPYLWSLCDLILAAEGVLGAINVGGWDSWFTGYTEEVDATKVPPEYYMEGGKSRPFEIPAHGEVTRTAGKVAPFQQARANPDAWRSLETMLGILQSSAPADELAGGGELASGHTGTVLDELDKAANRQIPEGCRQSMEFTAECIVGWCCSLDRGEYRTAGTSGVKVTLFVNEETEPEPGRAEVYAKPLEFKESWFGDIYDVTAKFPKRGNLAEVQQELGLWKDGAATLDDVLEKRGKTATMYEKMKIILDRELKDPASAAYQELIVAAMEFSGRDKQAKLLKLQNEQRLSEGGMPTAALAPGGGQPALPPGAAEATPGVELPDMAGSALGGITAGAIGSAARQNDSMAQLAVQAAGPNGSV